MRRTLRTMMIAVGTLTGFGYSFVAVAQEARGAIILPAQGDQVRMGAGPRPVLIKVDSATTGSGELFAFQVFLASGDSLPVHRHHKDDELIFVHAGVVRARVGDRKQLAPAGSTLFIPAGVPVGLVSAAKQGTSLFIVFGSQHMSEYIRSLGAPPGAPPRSLSRAERDSIALRHHITFP